MMLTNLIPAANDSVERNPVELNPAANDSVAFVKQKLMGNQSLISERWGRGARSVGMQYMHAVHVDFQKCMFAGLHLILK